jgi:KTSC domain
MPRAKSSSASRESQSRRAPDTTKALQDQTPAATSTTVANEEDLIPDYSYGFDSSRVVEAMYNPEAGLLFVRFVKPVGVGTKWTYEAVPPNVWRNFRRSASPGRYVNRVLNQYNNHPGRW